ncbi:MAG: GNAT family N-acetyltransferase [Dehalococcoidales bacterium]|nr:GNAT family N-acetyltransferase [Dehalococcoidales bacterium]
MAIVRAATENDIPRILELYRQLAIVTAPAELAQKPSLEDYRQVFARISAVPGLELLIAEEEGEVAGSLVLFIAPNLSHGGLPWALVENMIVDQKHRRQGIGRLLMDYAIARSKEAGCYRIGLSSDKKRQEAHHFYRSLGFQASAHGFRLYF